MIQTKIMIQNERKPKLHGPLLLQILVKVYVVIISLFKLSIFLLKRINSYYCVFRLYYRIY